MMLMAIEQNPKTLVPIASFVEGIEPEPVRISESLFPVWRVLLVEPNREQRAADILARFRMMAYLPFFMKQCKGNRPGTQRARVYAVIPGMLFVPDEHLDCANREAAFTWARVRGLMLGAGGHPAKLLKSDIEIIRIMEAKLNLPPERKGVLFEIGQEVRFTNDLIAGSWGTATIKEIASESRIGVEVRKLFGCPAKVYVPASEIEAV